MFDANKARENTNNYMDDSTKDILERIEEASKEGMNYYNAGCYLSMTAKIKLIDLGFNVKVVEDDYNGDQWFIGW
jgi:hypothetical protein